MTSTVANTCFWRPHDRYRVRLYSSSFRVRPRFEALARLAAAASLGIDGEAGEAETRQFVRSVLHPQDYARWLRVTACRATTGDYVTAVAMMIALLLARANDSGDPELQQWARDFRSAILAFRAGDQQAFTRLAAENAIRWGAVT